MTEIFYLRTSNYQFIQLLDITVVHINTKIFQKKINYHNSFNFSLVTKRFLSLLSFASTLADAFRLELYSVCFACHHYH